MAVNEPSPEGVFRGSRFIYVGIIPWQPVDKCYTCTCMSCMDGAARCHWSYATKPDWTIYSLLQSNHLRCLALISNQFLFTNMSAGSHSHSYLCSVCIGNINPYCFSMCEWTDYRPLPVTSKLSLHPPLALHVQQTSSPDSNTHRSYI